MGKDQKHMCKFCNKIFPCGRSLGGHMRSHLINISSSNHQKIEDKLPKKKFSPLISAKTNPQTDVLVEGGCQFDYVLRQNPKNTKKFSKKSEVDDLLEEKFCTQCGKTFQSRKALFGHMKRHSLVGRATNNVEEDSWNDPSDHQKPIMDRLSDTEAATAMCRRKRSDRAKRYTSITNSSSLTVANSSPCVSEIDQQEQEEVALSLILLSMDVGDLGCLNSVVDSSGTSSAFLEAKKSAKTYDIDTKVSRGECLKFKTLRKVDSDFRTPVDVPRKRCADEFDHKNLDIGCNKSEVNSPRTLINGLNHFGSDCKKKKSSKRKSINSHDPELNTPVNYKSAYFHSDVSGFCQYFEKKSKFICVVCKKAFPSYQALGGHRASHKKFKGCCAPTSENSLETENSPNQGENLSGVFEQKIDMGIVWNKNKEHGCPIYFKVFPSGQALGSHKRSHFISDQSKSSDPSVSTQKLIPNIQGFLDLNLPAPIEEECNDFKSCWIGTRHKLQLEPLLGQLSN